MYSDVFAIENKNRSDAIERCSGAIATETMGRSTPMGSYTSGAKVDVTFIHRYTCICIHSIFKNQQHCQTMIIITCRMAMVSLTIMILIFGSEIAQAMQY